MTKIDIISGFLGAGKTTLIKKLIAEAYKGEKLVLIENEFGEINIDGSFLKEAGIEISEMSAGCICCSLVGDFGKSLKQVYEQFKPDRILIEPSGVGKLSDVIVAVENTVKDIPELALNSYVTVADASKVKVYMKNFGEFYNNQIETAGTIVLSRTQKVPQEKLEAAVALLREKNAAAAILTTPWEEISGATILTAIEKVSLAEELLAKMIREHEEEEAEHAHHHHYDEHGVCSCGHHHDEDEDEEHEHHHHHHHDHEEGEERECHEHHHHHHDHEEGEECECHEHHHHHHDHDEGEECEHHHHHHNHDEEECQCGHHHDHEEHEHHHHHHHHADEVFASWGGETPHIYSEEELGGILKELDTGKYGKILRAKGIVRCGEGWAEFDYVPEEYELRKAAPDYTGRLCVIGAELKEAELVKLFTL